ncbi:hypothetical protein [Nonomuraea sp. MG754425]|nr:hypothetical protein [Nonomuraea sp. MG754425]
MRPPSDGPYARLGVGYARRRVPDPRLGAMTDAAFGTGQDRGERRGRDR